MIGIVGDVNLTDGYFDTGFGVGSAVAAGADPFAGINRKEGDIWIGNFEGVTARVSSKREYMVSSSLFLRNILRGLRILIFII